MRQERKGGQTQRWKGSNIDLGANYRKASSCLCNLFDTQMQNDMSILTQMTEYTGQQKRASE